ncbi:MAG: thiamine pyrophosphate-dependent dehydrogenase E1 component subunit alpha [Ignavibacteriales bacterium]
MYDTMLKCRFFEEKIAELFAAGKLHGTTHLYTGEEACAAGAVAALEPGDYITSTHRNHGHAIAKGADLNRMMAEIFGKKTGSCGGKGGSMHITDFQGGNIGGNGVVAGGISVATGAALALKMQGRSQIVLCFFGDGARAEGVFHESANLASIWKLPVVFLCENNQYAMSTAVHRYYAHNDAATTGLAYNMPGESVDGNDALAVYERVKAAVARARRNEGPSYVECRTYRWRGHSKSDLNRYRTREEIEAWMLKDPIARFRNLLVENGVAGEKQADEMERRARDLVENSVRFAERSPDPPLEDLTTGVYAETPDGEVRPCGN